MTNSTRIVENEIVKEFENHLRADGKAASTIESYVGDVSGFVQWFQQKGAHFDGNLKRFHVTSVPYH